MYTLTRNLGVGLGWTGSVLVILGRFLLANGNPWGFGVSILGDICWLIYGYEREMWSLVFLDAVLLSADLLGLSRGTLPW